MFFGRGAGELLGKKQSGTAALGCLRAASFPQDKQLLKEARGAAKRVLVQYGMDPSSWPQPLLAALRDRCPAAHPTLTSPSQPSLTLPGHAGWGSAR